MTNTLSISRVQKSHSSPPTVMHVQLALGKEVVMVEVSLEGFARALTGELGVEAKVIRNTLAT